ncbi:MAG TPA: P1 family peptidase [Candidatus Polarisedimenticolia bacterium]|nr:P1 family peptidase [Candidatus Polarisedimenticolia bacterium]
MAKTAPFLAIVVLALSSGLTAQRGATLTPDAKAAAFAKPAADNMTLTAVEGVKVGSVTLAERPTGCTAILFKEGTTGSVDVRGGAPGTRETDLLNPVNNVQIVNAISLAGGSAFGLDAASGVMKWLDEKNIGYPVGANGVVPIVPAAILFDLGFGGNPKIRPGADCGYKAAGLASEAPVEEGNVGAGAGATVGKSGGGGRGGAGGGPMKAGIGSAAIKMPSGLVVAAIVAVNAVGDIIDPWTGQVVAGARGADGKLIDARKLLRGGAGREGRAGENTTIGLVVTNAKLTKVQAQKMAQMAHDGYARAISPVHTPGDGDTIFSAATGTWDGTVNYGQIGSLAAEAMADAIVRAATQATASNGLPSARDLGTIPARMKQ